MKGNSLYYIAVLLMLAINSIALVTTVFLDQTSSAPLVIALAIFSSLGIFLGFLIFRRWTSAIKGSLIFYFVQIPAIETRYFGFDAYVSGGVDLSIWFNFGASRISIDLVALFMYASLRRMKQPMASEPVTDRPVNEKEDHVEPYLTDERGQEDESTQFVPPQSLIRRALLLYRPSLPGSWIKHRLPFYLLTFITIPIISVAALGAYVGPAKTPEGIPAVIFLVVIAFFLRDLEMYSDKKRG